MSASLPSTSRRRLTTLGYTVLATAGSGREAVQQAVALRPDLVGMDDLEAAAHIRAQAAIPIIYLTGSPEGEIPGGFTLQKPVMTQTLQQTIQLALATRDPYAPGAPMPRKDAAGRTASRSVLPVGTSGGQGVRPPGDETSRTSPHLPRMNGSSPSTCSVGSRGSALQWSP
jgi:CheY-like chemotaxis protein